MASAVHFGESFNWDQEEQKSRAGQRRRKEKKEKRKRMAEAREAQLHLVLLTILDKKCHNGVLEIFESKTFATAAFDSMIKQAQINTEAHPSRSGQLKEFRMVWPNITDAGKASFDELFGAVGILFERKYGLGDTDSSSEDEEKAKKKALLEAKLSTRWFSVNETETVLRIPQSVGKVVVDNLPGTFTSPAAIFKGKADAKEEVKEDEVKVGAKKAGKEPSTKRADAKEEVKEDEVKVGAKKAGKEPPTKRSRTTRKKPFHPLHRRGSSSSTFPKTVGCCRRDGGPL